MARAKHRVQPILLRVVPEVEVQTHEAIATGHDASKFGTSLADAPAVVREAIGYAGRALRGRACAHRLAAPGRRTLPAFARAPGDAARGIRDEIGSVATVLDVGGGFGVTYTDETALADRRGSRTCSRDRLETLCADHGLPVPQLVVEPGRSLVANAGVTLYRVGSRKQVARRPHAPRGRRRHVRQPPPDALRRSLHGLGGRGVGRASSTFTDRRPALRVRRHPRRGRAAAGDVGPGDLLAFAATGAYTYSLASTYNSVGRPAVDRRAGRGRDPLAAARGRGRPREPGGARPPAGHAAASPTASRSAPRARAT